MKQIAQDVFHIDCLRIPYAINAYVIGDVLVDAGGRRHAGRIMRAVGSRPLSAHAITHAHPDHQGASHAICTRLSIPFWVGEGDADAIIEKKGLKQITDSGALEKVIDQVMAANPSQLADFRAGKDKLFAFFVGQVMKATQGKANPAQLNELLQKKLKA